MSHFVRRRTQMRDREILMKVLKARGFDPRLHGETVVIPGNQFGGQEGSILRKIQNMASLAPQTWDVTFSLVDGEYVVTLNDDHILGAMSVELVEGQSLNWALLDPLKRECTQFMPGANYAGTGMDRNFETDIWKDYAVEQVKQTAATLGKAVAEVEILEDGQIRVVVEDEQDLFAGESAFAEASTTVTSQETAAFVQLF